MCKRCEDFDFPIAEIWKPCFEPRQNRGRNEIRERQQNSGQDFFESAQTIETQRLIIKQQHSRIAKLERELEAHKLKPTGTESSRRSFEGLE